MKMLQATILNTLKYIEGHIHISGLKLIRAKSECIQHLPPNQSFSSLYTFCHDFNRHLDQDHVAYLVLLHVFFSLSKG
jgi:hypothetical protein